MRFARAVLAASLVAGVSCAASAAAASHEITVGAAASLSVVFQQVGHAFERTHAGTSIRFTFSSSDGLATQIQQGAPIDVFASAAWQSTQSRPATELEPWFIHCPWLVEVEPSARE